MAAGVVSSAQQMELYYDRNWLPKPADVSHAFSGPEYGYQNLCLAEIDLNSIIVVHDLASHGSASGVRGEAYNHEDFWLEDLLQRDIPRARIMSFRPIWQVSFEADSTTRGLKARGIELLKSICEDRREDVRSTSSSFIPCITKLSIPERRTCHHFYCLWHGNPYREKGTRTIY